jgi:GR25 family glycosyltransferase involved in LPS biosynthesis
MWTSFKVNLPIDGIHFQPLIPERKRALLQMLRIEKHFAAKKQKLSLNKQIQDNEEEEETSQKKKKTQSKASSSLNSMTFNQL